MQNILRIYALATALLLASTVTAQDKVPIPDDDLVYCTVCHGIQMMGNPVIQAPRLSGMEQWYTERQLQFFKNGLRGTHEEDVLGWEMQPMAAALSDEQIEEAAAFVAASRSEAPAVTVSGDVARGKTLYVSCAACHGANAEGNELLGSPSLRIQNDWYLVTELQNFKSGVRGTHPGDVYGMQMRAAAQLLADDQAIRDVVSYISTLRNQ
jgi:cytochrome c oxidase subunit 2